MREFKFSLIINLEMIIYYIFFHKLGSDSGEGIFFIAIGLEFSNLLEILGFIFLSKGEKANGIAIQYKNYA
jgi:hypothetical protein